MNPGFEFDGTAVAAVTTTDFPRAVRWYTEMLGFEVMFTADEVGWAQVQTSVPGLSIGIQLDPSHQPGTGNATITLGVKDTDAARAALEARGVRFEGETTDLPGMVRLATFRDPDGNTLMFAGPSTQPSPGA